MYTIIHVKHSCLIKIDKNHKSFSPQNFCCIQYQFEIEMDLLKTLQYQHHYLDHYAKQIKVHLMLLHVPHVTIASEVAKKLANCCHLPNSPQSFPLKVIYCMVAL